MFILSFRVENFYLLLQQNFSFNLDNINIFHLLAAKFKFQTQPF